MIDVSIIEAMVYFAEIIDPRVGSTISETLDEVIESDGGRPRFAVAAADIERIVRGVPGKVVDDEDSREAYACIGELLAQVVPTRAKES